jgi:hypothetical protein
MASQVAHIVYAGKYLDRVNPDVISGHAARKYPFEEYEKLFLLGSCFPDIRRIEPKMKRSDTHVILSDLNADLKYLEPFQAGWKFHLFCDMRREEILNDYNFYDLSGTSGLWGLPNKLLEDEVVYDNCKNWEEIIRLFNNPPKIELPNFVARETFEIWCAILAKYFERKPDSKIIGIFLSKIPELAPVADEIAKAVDKLRKNDKVVRLLEKVKEEIIL